MRLGAVYPAAKDTAHKADDPADLRISLFIGMEASICLFRFDPAGHGRRIARKIAKLGGFCRQ